MIYLYKTSAVLLMVNSGDRGKKNLRKKKDIFLFEQWTFHNSLPVRDYDRII